MVDYLGHEKEKLPVEVDLNWISQESDCRNESKAKLIILANRDRIIID